MFGVFGVLFKECGDDVKVAKFYCEVFSIYCEIGNCWYEGFVYMWFVILYLEYGLIREVREYV